MAAYEVDLDAKERQELGDAGVTIVESRIAAIGIKGDKLEVAVTGDQETIIFDTLYPALGTTAHCELVHGLGAGTTADGCLATDRHQMTTVDLVYAAGDVVEGLDQISVACG